jgi:predicted metal-dependent hydrolase
MLNLLVRDLFRHSDFLEEKRDKDQRILIHSKVGKIVFRKSRRNRRIRISLHPDRDVLVTLPYSSSYDEADRFLCSKIDWISSVQAKLAQRHPSKKTYTPPEIEVLRNQAKATLPQRTAQLAALHGFSYSTISVKNMHSRWGSCSSTNRLNFSIHLTTLPAELIDYVVLHELCHTIHKNHGKQFWELLDKVTGGRAAAMAKRMKGYTI